MQIKGKSKSPRSFFIIVVAWLLLLCTISTLILPSNAASHNEFPKEVREVKDDNSIAYISTWVEGTVKINDTNSLWETKSIVTEYSFTSGFHCSESGHIVSPVHCIDYSETVANDLLLREYIMSVKWFDEGRFKTITYLEYYWSEEVEGYFNELKDKMDYGKIHIDNITAVYYVFSPSSEKINPHVLNDDNIRFRGNTEEGRDIVVFKLKDFVTPAPSVTFDKDFGYDEGAKLYIIHHGEYSTYNYMDRAVEDPIERPSEYNSVLRLARKKMFEDIKEKGANIESGYLGSNTREWGSTTTYRFTGYSPSGCSGAPVLDESGHCVGMITCGCELGGGIIDPTNAYFIPYEDLKDASLEAGIGLPEHIPLSEALAGKKWEIIIAVVIAVVLGVVMDLLMTKYKHTSTPSPAATTTMSPKTTAPPTSIVESTYIPEEEGNKGVAPRWAVYILVAGALVAIIRFIIYLAIGD